MKIRRDGRLPVQPSFRVDQLANSALEFENANILDFGMTFQGDSPTGSAGGLPWKRSRASPLMAACAVSMTPSNSPTRHARMESWGQPDPAHQETDP